jgi:CubicO group peptidase (beta-lactamase class C family)
MADHAQFAAALDLLDAGIGKDHDGYQLYVALEGRTLLDAAGGQARPGVRMTPETVAMWFSSGKVVTAIAIAQLWERGLLGLDDRVAAHLPVFGSGGKEPATVRHLLTHEGGFPFADDSLHPGTWDEMVAQICAAEAMWQPGTGAGYHGTSGYIVLGELVRVVDGRPIDIYACEEIFGPLAMTSSRLRILPEELATVRPHLSQVRDLLPKSGSDAVPGLDFEQFNEEPYLTALSPGMSARGPARDLGRLYELLLAGGTLDGVRLLSHTTVEAITACHRRGLVDQTFRMNGKRPHPTWGQAYPWALGIELDGNGDIGSRNSGRVYGSSGAFSSVGFADPETQLVCVILTNGLIPLNANEDRLSAVADAVNLAIGENITPAR